MGKKLTSFLGTPKPPKLSAPLEMPVAPDAIPVISEYDAGDLPEATRNAIRSGVPVIDVPPGFIKAQKKAARAAQKAARKARKKAGLKSGFSSGAPQSQVTTASPPQSVSGIFLAREVRPATGRRGYSPYLVVLLVITLLAAHLFGVI